MSAHSEPVKNIGLVKIQGSTLPLNPKDGRFLRKFRLENVRTFRSPATLDFCHSDGRVAQWTIILGENGTGKTTLLQYIAGLSMVPDDAAAYTSGSRHDAKPRPPAVRPLLGGREWFGWNQNNLPRGTEFPAQLSFGAYFSTPSASIDTAAEEIHESLDGKKRLGPYELGATISYNIEPDRSLQITVSYRIHRDLEYITQLRVFAYGASRHVAGPASPYLTSDSYFKNQTESPIGSLFNADVPLISPEQYLLGLDHASRLDGDFAKIARRTLDSAVRCLTAVLPELKGIRIVPRNEASAPGSMLTLCKTPFGEVVFSALSIGYLTMAAWLIDFVKRMHESFPDFDEPDNGPAIVLIDEFDLHMHPRWQREAMAALSKEFPNTQFIVTAHSPLVVQATEGHAKLIVLRRFRRPDGTHEVLVDDHPRYAAGWRVDQILSSSLYDMDPRSDRYSALMERNIRLRQKENRTPAEQEQLHELELRLEREAPPGISKSSQKLFSDLEKALGKVQAKRK